MQFIQWNPNADLGYIAGTAVGKGLGLLAENWINRGEVKNMDNEAAVNEANRYQGFLDQAKGLGNIKDDDKAGWAAGVANLGAQGLDVTGLTRDNYKSLIGGLEDRVNYYKNYQGLNDGKFLHGGDYTTFNQYKTGMPSLYKM